MLLLLMKSQLKGVWLTNHIRKATLAHPPNPTPLHRTQPPPHTSNPIQNPEIRHRDPKRPHVKVIGEQSRERRVCFHLSARGFQIRVWNRLGGCDGREGDWICRDVDDYADTAEMVRTASRMRMNCEMEIR
jgi:hypothetical protein